MSPLPIERRRVVFTGHVQGVGFRYTTAQLAERFAVAGAVWNREDGRVELDVQGPVNEVEGLLAAVGERFAGHVRSQSSETLPPLSDPSGFVVRR